ncbi:excinuclease ABC subunit UvrC [Labrys wisconsinensis]|uniref:UvrABC system protein C n=1 Tax=Labrys wisconsinensis TaxID=425677 RepID=A0ABU0JBR7_9HYPH|nr:excinuclease ABC subunit UvrC [Labrys wisconsinensis]MDQ0471723.1 excinuclease ABC subunit C [Labrys wisconsinensis]
MIDSPRDTVEDGFEEAASAIDFAFDEASLPTSLRAGAAVIHAFWKTLPNGPGVYRMIDAEGAVLYVGKARSLKKRVASYARGVAPTARIGRMIAETAAMEFVTTETETEALLLETNLIKSLKPRFNVLMRDDKSFPYILLTGDHPAPQLTKHRGARTRKGDYFGPFASVLAVNRTMNALERAFLVRSCTDSVFSTRTRPCLLHQIKRCSAPCTGEIGPEAYGELVGEARAFLTGKSKAIKERMAAEMQAAADELEFERAARYRDRLAALSAIQSTQGVNPQTVEEADVFAIHEEAGQFCIEVFFFRTYQNWGNRAYFPKADKTLTTQEVLDAFLAQFYDDKPAPRLVLLSHDVEGADLLGQALSLKAGHRIEVSSPKRGEKRDLVEAALTNAREALGRRLAESSSQIKLLEGVAEAFGLEEMPHRIEVYDNSHIMGTNAVGGMIVAGPDGFMKTSYRKFNIKSEELTPGDDFGMMREVLQRRFSRLLKEAPRAETGAEKEGEASPWPDLVLIDGGAGQLKVARETLVDLGIEDVPLVGVAKGLDRDAGRETFIIEGRPPFKLAPRDPVLYFVQRLRDEAHRFAIGAHRQKRSKSMREGGLQEIGGIGPQRKRALLHHFGTLKAISRASLADLQGCPGIDERTARKVHAFFQQESK